MSTPSYPFVRYRGPSPKDGTYIAMVTTVRPNKPSVDFVGYGKSRDEALDHVHRQMADHFGSLDYETLKRQHS